MLRANSGDIVKRIVTSSSSDVEQQPLASPASSESHTVSPEMNSPRPDQTQKTNAITSTGLKVLALLACQNAFKNILMRFVMKDHGGFLLSTAIIVVEILKGLFSSGYIIFVQKQSPRTIISFIRKDWKNTLLLIVPASAYTLQMSLEYIALANIDPASFSVLVQMKMLTTAFFFKTILKKKMLKKQLMSLVILTVGVMLCNIKGKDDKDDVDGNKLKGILATLGTSCTLKSFRKINTSFVCNLYLFDNKQPKLILYLIINNSIGIACSSGFASVYTEKVIKGGKKISNVNKDTEYGLAYTQVQLALVSLVILGIYAFVKDFKAIMTDGFFQNYDSAAAASSLNTAIGGLIVASVLKHADSVLKGYATAVSVVITGMASTVLFGTKLSLFYGMGIINVIIAVLLFNGSGLDDVIC